MTQDRAARGEPGIPNSNGAQRRLALARNPELRRRAQTMLEAAALLSPSADGDATRRLIEELCVYQSALEVQNEELRGAEQALERSQRRYAALFEAMPVACFTLDGDGAIGEANRQAETLFGVARRRLRGQPLLSLIEAPDHARLLGHVRAVRATGRPRREEFTFKPASGGTVVGLVECNWLPQDGPDDGAVLCAVTDVTETAQTALRLREANDGMRAATRQAELALAAKTKFLATASHDLRQPVQALSLFVDVLTRRKPGQDLGDLVGRISDSVASIRELLDGLLDLSRIEAGFVLPDWRKVEVAETMHRLGGEFSALAQAKGLRFRLCPLAATLLSDPPLLERLLRNVLSNALRYTEQGGILFGARRRGEWLRVEVWDSGIGIPEAELDAIFEDFHQVHNPGRNREAGLGLGLAISGRLARLLGGRIGVVSAIGRGSCFRVDLPLARDHGDGANAGMTMVKTVPRPTRDDTVTR